MEINDIERVLIIGAGTMGRQIGLQCAAYGYQVTLSDIDPEQLTQAMAQIKAYIPALVAQKKMTQLGATDVVARTTTTEDSQAAAQVDLVSESVPEDPELTRIIGLKPWTIPSSRSMPPC